MSYENGTVKSRAELFGAFPAPFSTGQRPKDQDYDDFAASVFFPAEDDASRIAVDQVTKELWDAYFEDLPLDEAGRLLLQGMLNRLLVWVSQRLQSPAFRQLPGVVYVDGDTFTVAADVSTEAIPGRRIRASLGGLYVYGTITTRTLVAGVTTINLTMDSAPLNSALDGADLSLFDLGVIPPMTITADDIDAEAIEEALGYTPANQAGDTFGGTVKAQGFVVEDEDGSGARYGKLTVTTVAPGPADGADGDIWFVVV